MIGTDCVPSALCLDLHLGSAVRQVRLEISANPVAGQAHSKLSREGDDAAGQHRGLWSASAYIHHVVRIQVQMAQLAWDPYSF